MQNVRLVHESLLKKSLLPRAAGDAASPARASGGSALAVAAVAGNASANKAAVAAEPTITK
jgi:hypothetical protein